MILTFTANPSLDRTVTLSGALVPGGVHRIEQDQTQPGGKGINVALGLKKAGAEVLAVFPASPSDPLLEFLEAEDLPFEAIPVRGAVRTNIAVLTPGQTTKINEPGSPLSGPEVSKVESALVQAAKAARFVMLSGSLAPGFPEDAYADLVELLRPLGTWVGVDTSDAPLLALARRFPGAAPDFLKPNAEELASLTGRDGTALEAAAAAGDFGEVKYAIDQLRGAGVGTVLVTLGGAGAVLGAEEGTWYSPSPDVAVISTVGAGDSATAGYLLARSRELSPPEALAHAIAYGAAAVSLPGTTIPSPDQVEVDLSAVAQI